MNTDINGSLRTVEIDIYFYTMYVTIYDACFPSILLIGDNL